MINQAIDILFQQQDLSALQMESTMQEIMSGKAELSQIVSFLALLNRKGETIEELTAAAKIMRAHAITIKVDDDVVLDTCGTGGDRKGTFNISTTVAFVASGAGITVAKHGNRSVSSKSGSADILEALGVNINMNNEQIEECLKKIGVAFLFAPNLHPAMKYAAPARKQIGSRTMFNILGPLTNPAGAKYQLIGVYEARWAKVLAQVLANLGSIHALVVHGEDGLDELTTTSDTLIAQEYRGSVDSYKVCPEDFGLKRAKIEDLSGGTAAENADILIDILKGEPGAKRDIVVLNAAAAIYAADKVNSIKEGIKLACQSIDSGAALRKLELLREYGAVRH